MDSNLVNPVISSNSLLSTLSNKPHIVGATWILSSALWTTYSTTKFLIYDDKQTASSKKQLLSRPTLLTLFRFGGSLLLGLLLHPDLHILNRLQETFQAASLFFFPACCLFLANFTNSIALKRLGIPLTYTSKCAIPIMTALFSLFLEEALPNTRALFALIPIVVGIAAASWNTPNFEVLGFAAALISTTAQSALNISSKRVMTKTNITGPKAQRAMVAVGFGITALITIIQKAWKQDEKNQSKATGVVPGWLCLSAVTAYHLEYVLSFSFVRLVHPITYGTCDAVRRLAIILAGRKFFGGPPPTALNRCGIGLALLGVLWYSITTS